MARPSSATAALARPTTTLRIARAYWLDRALLEVLLADLGISSAQRIALQRVADNPGAGGAELARSMWKTPQATNVVLSQLESMKLIVRPKVSRGRASTAELTPAGKAMLAACEEPMNRFYASLGAGFTPTEREMFDHLLDRFIDGAKSALAEVQAPKNGRPTK